MAASWRPQTITAAEFHNRLAPPAPSVDFEETADDKTSALTSAQKQLKGRINAKGWQPRSLSPDGKLVLAEKEPTAQVALLNAADASVAVKLQTPKNGRQGEMSAGEFSSDGKLVAFSRFEVSATQVFDAQTGARLWQGEYWGEMFGFSPDGKFAAHTNAAEDSIIVRDSMTGQQWKRLPSNWTSIFFSRDSSYLLAETAPGQYQQLRLR